MQYFHSDWSDIVWDHYETQWNWQLEKKHQVKEEKKIQFSPNPQPQTQHKNPL